MLYAVLGVIVVSCLYWIATRIISHAEAIAPAAADRAPFRLADEHLQPQDVIEVRLPVAVRGYRFAETDLLLDRLTEELRLRDEEIARLQHHLSLPSAASGSLAGDLATEQVDDEDRDARSFQAQPGLLPAGEAATQILPVIPSYGPPPSAAPAPGPVAWTGDDELEPPSPSSST